MVVLDLPSYRHVVVLTGAGISVASGLPTFRGPGGLWERPGATIVDASPASNFVRSAAYAGARTILVNLEPMKPAHPDFQEELLGRAEDLLPTLLESA